jgi:thiamine pyrophosphate-dependent acetolactate synthase large subunit-like protein
LTDYADLKKRLREWADAQKPAETDKLYPRALAHEAAAAIAALEKQVEDAREQPWPEWAEKLLRLLQEWGAEYEADDEINLPDELAEWLHHYASDLKQAARRKAALSLPLQSGDIGDQGET